MVASDKAPLMQILKQISEFERGEIDIAEEVIDIYLKDPINSGYYILVAEYDSSLAGYIEYGDTPLTKGTWDIYWMAVEPQQQGKGIGKVLIAAAESDIKKRQGRLILIETSSKPQYEKTRSFHIARGYTLTCRIVDFYSPGDDLLIFEKRLE
jgi:ribosomal protein S18 acetylase RimI-like enzyme